MELKISIIFSYDPKQYLQKGESKNLYQYMKDNYPNVTVIGESLTNKIRTNKEMASFITNLRYIGKSITFLCLYRGLVLPNFQILI